MCSQAPLPERKLGSAQHLATMFTARAPDTLPTRSKGS